MKMNSKAPFILYGGDYNPDQWDDEIIEKEYGNISEKQV